MTLAPVALRVGDVHEVEALLAQRVHDYNLQATGFGEAESFCATVQDDAGALQAGISGYTWGGCCHIDYLWVDRSQRRRGLGSRLVEAVEEHARHRRCVILLVSSHSFQAPGFYERLGFRAQAVVPDHPPGHTNIVLAKRLPAA